MPIDRATVYDWNVNEDRFATATLAPNGTNYLATYTSEIFKLADSETYAFATFTIATVKKQATLSWELKILHLGAPFDANVGTWCKRGDQSWRQLQQGEYQRARKRFNKQHFFFLDTTTRFDHANMNCKLVWTTPVNEQLCALANAPFLIGFRIQRACATIEGLNGSLVFTDVCEEAKAKTLRGSSCCDNNQEIKLRVSARSSESAKFKALGATLSLGILRLKPNGKLTAFVSIQDATAPIALSCSVEVRDGDRRLHSPFVGKRAF